MTTLSIKRYFLKPVWKEGVDRSPKAGIADDDVKELTTGDMRTEASDHLETGEFVKTLEIFNNHRRFRVSGRLDGFYMPCDHD